MKKYIVILILFLSTLSKQVRAQNDTTKNIINKACDTINRNTFNKKVRTYYRLMKKGKEFLMDEYITIVKLYFSFNKTGKQKSKIEKLYKDFIDIYQVKYMNRYCEKIDCVTLRGLALYSLKYNLYLSLTTEKLPCYNFFYIK